MVLVMTVQRKKIQKKTAGPHRGGTQIMMNKSFALILQTNVKNWSKYCALATCLPVDGEN